MLDLFKNLDARLSEPSTWAAIAAVLVGVGIHLDPGSWQTISQVGVALAGAAGVLLAERK